MSEENKKEEKSNFTQEEAESLNQKLNEDGIPEFDVLGTLQSLEAYSHFMNQCPEEHKEKVLEDVKEKTDAWQKVFDGIKEVIKEPEGRAHLRKLIKDNWKK